MNSIYGMIGYTILVNNNKKVLIMADRHDDLPKCPDSYESVAKWMKSKFNSSDILLEEVERSNSELGELWSSSEHTQELKNLYLDNSEIIVPIDIRNDFIPYSWEVYTINEPSHNIKMYEFLGLINNFFMLKNNKLNQLDYYNSYKLKNTPLGQYYLQIKKRYTNFVYKNIKNLRKYMGQINRSLIFEEFNDILHDILEWYAVSKIINSEKESIIIHTGLAHSDKIMNILVELFGFKIHHQEGTNEMNNINETNMKSCFKLPSSMHAQFGGFCDYYL